MAPFLKNVTRTLTSLEVYEVSYYDGNVEKIILEQFPQVTDEDGLPMPSYIVMRSFGNYKLGLISTDQITRLEFKTIATGRLYHDGSFTALNAEQETLLRAVSELDEVPVIP